MFISSLVRERMLRWQPAFAVCCLKRVCTTKNSATNGFMVSKSTETTAKQFTPEKTEELTGVPANLVVEAAHIYAQGPGSFALTSVIVSHSTNGVNNTRAWLCVPVILGYVDIPRRCIIWSRSEGYICHDNGLTKEFVDYKWFQSHKKDRLDK